MDYTWTFNIADTKEGFYGVFESDGWVHDSVAAKPTKAGFINLMNALAEKLWIEIEDTRKEAEETGGD